MQWRRRVRAAREAVASRRILRHHLPREGPAMVTRPGLEGKKKEGVVVGLRWDDVNLVDAAGQRRA